MSCLKFLNKSQHRDSDVGEHLLQSPMPETRSTMTLVADFIRPEKCKLSCLQRLLTDECITPKKCKVYSLGYYPIDQLIQKSCESLFLGNIDFSWSKLNCKIDLHFSFEGKSLDSYLKAAK